jgi:BMFP domain-containing protein YqiC
MIENIARTIFSEVKNAIPTQVTDLPEKELRALLEGVLKKLNLVSREEFDAQQAVLGRTREKVEALEKQLVELEALTAQK